MDRVGKFRDSMTNPFLPRISESIKFLLEIRERESHIFASGNPGFNEISSENMRHVLFLVHFNNSRSLTGILGLTEIFPENDEIDEITSTHSLNQN